MGKLVKVLGYYVLASTLNVNCDFTPTLLVSAFLPLLLKNEGSIYPYSVNSMQWC
jgi:hypothetical protein